MSEEGKRSSPHYGIYPFDPEAEHGVTPQEGQPTLWSEKEIREALNNPAVIVSTKEQRPTVNRRELRGRGWDTLVLNEGTRDEIKMLGRFYTISADRKTPLDIRSSPPETRDSMLLGRVRGIRVFVLKDSEQSEDPSGKGWAEVIVLEITPKGEKPKIKKFSDGIRDIVLCRARFEDIQSRGKK